MVADLDALIAEPVGFRFQGKVYRCEPVDTKTFLQLAEVLEEVRQLIKSQGEGLPISSEQIYEAYHRYISAVCPDFTISILKAMTLPQVHGLLNLVIKHVTGQPMAPEDTEKKKMTDSGIR